MLILGGTSDARELARALRAAGLAVVLTMVSDYAGQLAGDLSVRVGALDAAGLREALAGAALLIDATHPFATVISEMAIEICAECGVPYLRYERAESELPPGVLLAASADEAARLAVERADGGTILLTVGSKTLAVYVAAARQAGCRVVARVLPTVEGMLACGAAGLAPGDIIGLQGPTSAELDAALIRHFTIRVLVTKESGTVGGVDEKVRAAEMTGIPLVVVCRPPLRYPRIARGIEEILEQVHA